LVVHGLEIWVFCRHFIDLEKLGRSGFCPLTFHRDFSLRPVGNLKLAEQTKWLLLGDLPPKLIDKLAEGFEFLCLLAHNFDKLFAVENQAY
jgi:hypothetical protein